MNHEAALADAATEAAPQELKKKRKPKMAPIGEVGNVEDLPKKEKAPRVRKPKMIQATDEAGELLFNEDGTPTMVEAPKKERAPAASRKSASYSTADGEAVAITGDAALDITMAISAPLKVKEGSKRAARYEAFVDGNTVDQFLKAGGAIRDMHRLARQGSVRLIKDGVELVVS
jgi:hypothetical protein